MKLRAKLEGARDSAGELRGFARNALLVCRRARALLHLTYLFRLKSTRATTLVQQAAAAAAMS